MFGIHRYLRTFADKDGHQFERYILQLEPLAALVTLACEEVNPLGTGSRQIDIAAVFAVHDGADQEIVTEVILVVDMPAGLVIGMLEDECL